MKLSMPSFVAGLSLGGLVTLLDFFEKLKPYGIDVPGFVTAHPYISTSIVALVILVFFIVTIFRNKREAKRENQLKAEQEKIEISMYEHLAKTFNEKYPDNVFCTPSSFSSFYSDTFITNKPAIHLSKQIMIELDCRGLAKLEKDNQGNFILKKVKK